MLSDIQFQYWRTPRGSTGGPTIEENAHIVEASREGNPVGKLIWSAKTKEIRNIEVDSDHRRQGVATAMWNYANDLDVPKPKHSSDRTEAGDAWARSVSRRLPPRA